MPHLSGIETDTIKGGFLKTPKIEAGAGVKTVPALAAGG